MQKVFAILALLIAIWLAIDILRLPNVLLNFILLGEIPVFNVRIESSVMLVIMIAGIAVILFEIASRRFEAIRDRRKQFTKVISHRTKRVAP